MPLKKEPVKKRISVKTKTNEIQSKDTVDLTRAELRKILNQRVETIDNISNQISLDL